MRLTKSQSTREVTLYVVDRDGSKIRKISPAGEVTTLAGSGSNVDTDGTGSRGIV